MDPTPENQDASPTFKANHALNDVHSRINPTVVAEYHEPAGTEALVGLVRRARDQGMGISVSGKMHAMGGQQFGEGTLHLHLHRHNRILDLDDQRGWVTVQSGITWPDLIRGIHERTSRWGIRQKQTGADDLTIGGALAANAHGRGLTLQPMIGDVESFTLVDASANVVRCSREENPDLFSLVIGGYSLFGIVDEVVLRLSPRQRLIREVEILRLEEVPATVEQRIQDGFLYGDFQFMTDENSEDYLRKGVFSFYRPAAPDEDAAGADHRELQEDDWIGLFKLAHLDKARAYEVYSAFYLSTHGQAYWSDTHQLSIYLQGYDSLVDQLSKSRAPGSLMICEYYVARKDLPEFMERLRRKNRETGADVIYGTVRYIEKDTESFLAWARESWACVVINLRILHDAAGLDQARTQFRAITDTALELGGSYFLTYHRWATREQALKAYPQLPEFLERKRRFDPEERFQSDWYRHMRDLLGS